MYRAHLFAFCLCFMTVLLIALILQGFRQAVDQEVHWEGQRQLVSQLGLTDLALWSEARYTRHISQADLFTPFQNMPGAPDLFPAGSILPPAFSLPQTRVEVVRQESSQ